MARIHILTARKGYKCGKCGKPIEKGSTYLKYVLRPGGPGTRGSTNRRHAACRPRASEMTSSEYLGGVYAAQESFEDALNNADSIDDLLSALAGAKYAIEDVKSTCEEKKDNLEQAFQGGCPGIELQEERIGACDLFIGSAEDAEHEVEQLRDRFDKVDGREEGDEPDEDDDDAEDTVESVMDEAREAAEGSLEWPG